MKQIVEKLHDGGVGVAMVLEKNFAVFTVVCANSKKLIKPILVNITVLDRTLTIKNMETLMFNYVIYVYWKLTTK